MCGMACLSMVLSHNAVDHAPLVVLGKRCARYGGYVVQGDEIDGLFYAPFADFVADEFGLHAAVAAPMTTGALIGHALGGDYVIASVHPAIRHPSSRYCGPVGGHLVLVVGVDANQRSIWINNPSGDTTASQEYAELSLEDFGRYYAGRGIVVSSSSFLKKR